MRLKDKVAIITGGSRGIGYAAADKFLKEGAAVIVTASTQGSADRAVTKLKEKYPDAIVDGMLKGLGEQVSCVRYNTITMAMDVLLLRALLPRFGLAAYLLSFAVTHLVNFALSLRRLLAVTGHAPDIRYAVRALLCTAGAAAAAFSVFGPGLWPILLGRTALFAVSFAGLLRLTGTLERSDTVWLRQALRGH